MIFLNFYDILIVLNITINNRKIKNIDRTQLLYIQKIPNAFFSVPKTYLKRVKLFVIDFFTLFRIKYKFLFPKNFFLKSLITFNSGF